MKVCITNPKLRLKCKSNILLINKLINRKVISEDDAPKIDSNDLEAYYEYTDHMEGNIPIDFTCKVSDNISIPGSTRKYSYQIVGFPLSEDMIINIGKDLGMTDEDVIIFELRYEIEDNKLPYQIQYFKQPCCYYDVLTTKAIIGYPIHQHNWIDMEILGFFELQVLDINNVWKRFLKELSPRDIEYCQEIHSVYNLKNQSSRFFSPPRPTDFVLEYLELVVFGDMTINQFIRQKNLTPDKLYSIFFKKVCWSNIDLLRKGLRKISFKDHLKTSDPDSPKIVNIIMADDCYTCT
jgi:hypothetical protein